MEERTHTSEELIKLEKGRNFLSDENEAPFIILETKGLFHIKPESWRSMYDAETNTISLEKSFARHLSVIMVGTSRGILHTRTEGTNLNHVILPLINVEAILNEDLTINLEKEP